VTSSRSGTLGWVALAASGGLLGTGVAAHLIREHNAAIYNDDARCYHGSLSRVQRCGSYGDKAKVAEIVAIIGYAAGGAALITGVTLLLTSHEAAAKTPIRLGANASPSSVYVSLTAAF
jgi:hypothetical protein